VEEIESEREREGEGIERGIYMKVSISSTFYTQIFCTKVLCRSFSLITVLLCNFLAKEYISAKAARKMLLKLIKGG